MTYKLVIDADSLLYTSCYRNQVIVEDGFYEDFFGTQKQDGFTYCKLELAYIDFVATVYNIKSALWVKFKLEKEDTIEFEIVFSPKKTFRNDLSEAYKAKRTPSTIVGIGDLKELVIARIGATEVDNLEADDVVITRAYEQQNVIVACIDKDIFTHCPTWCFNYKKWEWIEPSEEGTIEDEYIYQSIKGDSTDGVSGAKGKGDKFCEQFVYGLEPWNYDSWEACFDSPEAALLNMRLVRMDQYKKGELILWTKP